VDAIKRGATDYLGKPFEEEELALTLENALEKQRLRNEVRQLRKRLDRASEPVEFISASPRMERLRRTAEQVADTDAPVLILGETGVGKEILALHIHRHSGRAAKPFVKVNCAALPHDLLESELFGYERGAFSGAVRDKPGKFELAHGGSILLDEIAEMSTHLQAKLLHVLQDGEYGRLGSQRPTRVDARILASTNQPLDKAVAEGSFRQDLYFRINVIRLEVPPLRERPEDIPLLANAFLRRYVERYGTSVPGIPPEMMEGLLRHDWPGNVRELENVVRRFAILPDPKGALAELSASPIEPSPSAELERDAPLRSITARAADRAELEVVRRVLTETGWNRREAARRLKVSYKTLLKRLKKWRLDEETAPPADR
jgi:two-component system response regulator AtoC